MYAGMFSKIRWNTTAEVRKQLYYSFVLPTINFAIESYGSTSAIHIKKIQTIQNRILKILMFKEPRTKTNTLHHEFGVLKVKDLYKLRLLKFVFNYVNNKCSLPVVLRNKLTQNSEYHGYRTRRRDQFRPAKTRTEFGKRSPFIQAVIFWNNLDESTKEIRNEHMFIKKAKKAIIEEYVVK